MFDIESTESKCANYKVRWEEIENSREKIETIYLYLQHPKPLKLLIEKLVRLYLAIGKGIFGLIYNIVKINLVFVDNR